MNYKLFFLIFITTPIACMESMSNEVVRMFFEHMVEEKRKAVARVSKTWNFLVNTFPYCPRELPAKPLKELIVYHAGQLKELKDTEYYHISLMREIDDFELLFAPNICSLTIQYVPPDLDSKSIDNLVDRLCVAPNILKLTLATWFPEAAFLKLVEQNKYIFDMHLVGHIPWKNKYHKKLSCAFTTNNRITKLNLCKCELSSFPEIITYNKAITDLRISSQKIDTSLAKSIRHALQVNEVLTNFECSFCKLKTEDLVKICKSLKRNKTLRALDVSYNKLRSPIAEPLCKVLVSNTTLQTLKLMAQKERISNEDQVILKKKLPKLNILY